MSTNKFTLVLKIDWMLQNFEELAAKPEIRQAIREMGITIPTPIQAQALPVALEGKDVMGQAQTGTGKTLAFAVPILQRVDLASREVQALVLCPTRELAEQVCVEVKKIGKHTHVRALPVYGGTSIERQVRELRAGVQLVVGTPGRVMDHMNRGNLRLDHVKMLVLDEADRMLDMGFIEDIEWILNKLPRQRQTMLFSATIPWEIRDLAQKFMLNPQLIAVSEDRLTVEAVNQVYYEIDYRDRFNALIAILREEKPEMTLIFCRTKRETDFVADKLKQKGFNSLPLHGDLTQARRERVIDDFKSGKIDILVATDVAARGLDISGISHIINYSMPTEPTTYVHRIGRTARAGEKGDAITFVGPQDWLEFKKIKLLAGEIKPAALPPGFKPAPPAPPGTGFRARPGGQGFRQGRGFRGGPKHGPRPGPRDTPRYGEQALVLNVGEKKRPTFRVR